MFYPNQKYGSLVAHLVERVGSILLHEFTSDLCVHSKRPHLGVHTSIFGCTVIKMILKIKKTIWKYSPTCSNTLKMNSHYIISSGGRLIEAWPQLEPQNKQKKIEFFKIILKIHFTGWRGG